MSSRQPLNFLSPPAPQLSLSRNPGQMGFPILNSSSREAHNRPLVFQQSGIRGTRSELSLKFVDDQEQSSKSKSTSTRRTKLCARGHWRPAEDAKLKELVDQHGPQNWNLIAESLEGRSGKSCRLRWFNQLDPRINRRAFSDEEEEKLLAAHRLYGNKWAMIARLFPGRTDNSVKNHWHVVMARKQREQTSVFKRRKSNNTTTLPSQFLAKQNNNNTSNSESTIDEPEASSCTDLSLTPTSNTIPRRLFDKLYRTQMGVAENGLLYQSGQSDSNSESASVAESSYATNMSNLTMFGENKNGIKKSVVQFIDFLGVGAT
ncbi:hypothetical protein UlMin_006754 [Ulmus minor]